MSLWKHCDNPACNTHVKVADWTLPTGDGWIKVNEGDLHFCSWRCVQVFASGKLPRVSV
jgi:hypothetical protein